MLVIAGAVLATSAARVAFPDDSFPALMDRWCREMRMHPAGSSSSRLCRVNP
jgi:hypothetical protein